ncbi:DUF6164 family protein [Marinobacter lutaoensis]|jgi:hypothetical protein|uniref:Transmembrane protein n=1 Tax=Marinobacter lutaoensis TaxID=135739 RepID=A0A1V2DUK6_9GAMM|nr:DUF6164 family protein [Marinobacter lutaoensis]MBE02024.1 hypothetical protein [Marinobacter sp.]MBI43949.1 hypothetical protein [Oceanospirillales bacterium]NVD34277.1 hypothetical protein [Marinobacter lutaoensis]ONF44425.1 hypothetical protein BTO32_05420 [Marinobacter lutaoensis]
MPHHLMNLRHVPDDEADEIRTLFEAHGIRYYETPPSRWGISMGGFWTHDDGEATRARQLLEDYQRQRRQRQREAYQARLARGEAGFWRHCRRHPVTVLAASLAIAGILAFSLAPFLGLG